MATVNVNDFSILIQTNNRLKFEINYTVTPNQTEARLGIPIHIHMKLMQKKGNIIDRINLYANDVTTVDPYERDQGTLPPGTIEPINPPTSSGQITTDVQCSDWEYAGLFVGSNTNSYSFYKNRANLPGDDDTENWYVAIVARPDITSSVSFSDTLELDIRG